MSAFRLAARALLRAAAALIPLAALAPALSPAPAHAEEAFLEADQAFQVTARAVDDHRVQIDYRIAKGYYLYRERFKFESPAATQGPLQIPPGAKHYDTALEQQVETYHDAVSVVVPFTKGAAAFDLVATHQGCAEKGLCYPPQTRTLHVQLKGLGASVNDVLIAKDGASTGGGASNADASSGNGAGAVSARDAILGIARGNGGEATAPPSAASGATATDATPAAASQDQRLDLALKNRQLWVLLPVAFLIGLGLAFTPCVLPMLPILSSIIVGQSGASISRGRGLALSAAYSLGMALVYTALGVAAGLAGEGLAAYLQKPAVLAGFSIVLALLSLSMFGVYELQLPEAWRDHLNARSASLVGGQMGGVFAMGVLSALIVSPCVTAPLGGILLYISQTRDALLGGLGLFMIAAGMSVPLLLVGASAGALLPRGGAWMNRVKLVFGLLLLGVAIYIVQPVLPLPATLVLWGLLLLVGGTAMGAFETAPPGPHAGATRLFRGLALVMALFGAMELIGAASGARDPLQPLARLAQGGGAMAATVDGPRFERVSSVDELDRRIREAGRPVMLDFYADWCVSCKEMESRTFTDPAVRERMSHMLLLRADVTANSADDRALLQRFHLFGPPGIVFWSAQGTESPTRVVGFQDAPTFVQSLATAGL